MSFCKKSVDEVYTSLLVIKTTPLLYMGGGLHVPYDTLMKLIYIVCGLSDLIRDLSANLVAVFNVSSDIVHKLLGRLQSKQCEFMVIFCNFPN